MAPTAALRTTTSGRFPRHMPKRKCVALKRSAGAKPATETVTAALTYRLVRP